MNRVLVTRWVDKGGSWEYGVLVYTGAVYPFKWVRTFPLLEDALDYIESEGLYLHNVGDVRRFRAELNEPPPIE